jgi:hypothetical protein
MDAVNNMLALIDVENSDAFNPEDKKKIFVENYLDEL